MLNSVQFPRFGASANAPGQLIAFPKFASSLPPYDKSVDVRQDGNFALDVFQPENAQSAKIVLVPKNAGALEELIGQAQGKEGVVASLLKKVLGEADESPATQHLAYVDTVKGADAGKKNTQVLLKAFEDKLDSLGEGTREVTAVLPTPLPEGVKATDLVRKMATMATLKGYNYRFHKADNSIRSQLESVFLNRGGVVSGSVQAALAKGKALGRAMNLTRHLVDSPANFATTRYISEQALKLQSGTMAVNVLSGDDLEGKTAQNNKRMGLFLSVAQGNDKANAAKDPRLVEMVHTPEGWDPETGRTIVLVGKGIIFDTGGNDLKPSEYHHNMRGDMAGAAAVLGTMKALDERPVGGNVRVVGLMPLTENRLNGASTLEQDIYTARSGVNAYIGNTDAEGRLVLSDAMNYGLEKYSQQGKGVDAAFTIATLTGAKTKAVGEQNAIGVMGNNPTFINGVNQVIEGDLGRTTGVVPFDQRHFDMITQKGEGPADVQNASRGRHMQLAGLYDDVPGVDKAALAKAVQDPAAFRALMTGNKALEEAHMKNAMADGGAFIQAAGMHSLEKDAEGNVTGVKQYEVPWAHLDIAGADFGAMDPKRGNHEWATGIGVEDLYSSIEAIASGRIKPDAGKTVLPKPNFQASQEG